MVSAELVLDACHLHVAPALCESDVYGMDKRRAPAQHVSIARVPRTLAQYTQPFTLWPERRHILF